MSVQVTIHINAQTMEKAIQKAALLAGEHILQESQRIVPLETGDLQRAGHVQQDGDTVTVGYSSPYAVVQHEELDYHHAPGRSAKYLEKPANASGPAIAQIFAQQLGQVT